MAESKLTWSQWLEGHKVSEGLIRISPELGDSSWDPTEKDREAAWILYTELRTRITTQPLHYRSGDEETALKSLYDLFDLTRKTIEDKGPECRHFATIAIQVLNTHIRPLTAKWHKKTIAGRLQNDDDRREFRQELQAVQGRLVEFCRLLASLAEADAYLDGDACGSGQGNGGAGKTNAIGHAIPFDRILLVDQVPGGADLLTAEVNAIRERRAGVSPAPATEPVADLVGLACSGGGIRSATFCLGVAQALARHGILARVDYLSTVSGGGYFGAFLSSYLNDTDHQLVGLKPGKLPFAEADRAEPAADTAAAQQQQVPAQGWTAGSGPHGRASAVRNPRQPNHPAPGRALRRHPDQGCCPPRRDPGWFRVRRRWVALVVCSRC